MTPERLSEIKARRGAITDEEWKTGSDFEGSIGVWLGKAHWLGWDIENSCRECFANLEFIAHAPKDIDALIAEVECLRSGLAKIEQRWRKASRDNCFKQSYRYTMEECANELVWLLNSEITQ